ncbi:alpha/beta hydrolase [Streptomyces sp. NPDC020379]|uniref:alpha/beta hydrolase n=1 Tax=Streptomyces sp. NPDC020379 TaxID=3365071 RepID=UPI0037AD1891
MVTIDELTKLDRSKFTKAAEAWSKVSNRASVAKGRTESEMLATLDRTQQGDAATKAFESLTRLNKNYQYIHAECGLIRTALTGLAEELEGPQNKLKQALKDAEDLKFTVNSDGSVKYPTSEATKVPFVQQPARAENVPLIGKPDPNQAKAQEIADRIATALRDAAEIDGRYAQALRKLNTNGKLDQTDWSDVARDLKDVRAAAGKHFSEDMIPKGKTPKENADWWAKRTQAEKDECVALYPASIGALDGLPAVVRDDANRMVLSETRQDIDRQIKELEGSEPKKREQKFNDITGLPIQGEEQTTYQWKRWDEKKKALEEKLKGIKQIEKRFDETGDGGLPKAYLLGFDTKGLGRAVIANGNPDTAEHTAVYVPGTTSRLSNASGDINKMTTLWRASNAMPGNPSVSTITWIGYDAPQSAMPTQNGDLVPDALFRSYADKAAPTLGKFLDGTRVAQGGPHASHLTVVGHSYGTTAIGDTSIKHGLGADDIVSVASPGMLVGHADELDAPKGHVWSEAASTLKDQVPLGGKLVGLGGDSPITPLISALPFGVVGEIGALASQNVPSDRAFGANIMQTDSDGHGGYWKGKDSISVQNQAAVVTGNYGAVKRA